MKSEKMQVSVRLTDKEGSSNSNSLDNSPYTVTNNKLTLNEKHLTLIKENPKFSLKLGDNKSFHFDSIFNKNSSQSEVFEKSSKFVIDGLFSGLSGSILAYGQSKSGKSYTMMGNPEVKSESGIAPRTFEYIFEKVKSDKKSKFNLFMSYLEIYMERIYDLFEPANEQIRINDDYQNNGRVKIEGVQWVKVNTPDECMNMIQLGQINKLNNENDQSSTHSVVILRLEKTSMEKGTTSNGLSNMSITKANLFLVDLAGSEKVKKSRNGKMRLEEFAKINLSLSILKEYLTSYSREENCNVIHNPTPIQQFSYKNSKLTRLLQDSLKGNTRVSLLVTIPLNNTTDKLTTEDEETLNNLQFAQKAMTFTTQPNITITKEMNYQSLSSKLQEDLDSLNDEYTKLKKEFDLLNEENKSNKEEIFSLKRKIITNNEISKIKPDLEKIEEIYREKYRAKDSELLMVLEETENIILEKEQINDLLRLENKSLKDEHERLNLIIKDLNTERDELVNKLINFEENFLIQAHESINLSQSNLLRRASKSIEKVHQETQTESEVMDPQLAELLRSVGRKGKSLMETVNFKENNNLYKLEYFIVRFEKEIFRLNKENKELKDKMRKIEENGVNSTNISNNNNNYNFLLEEVGNLNLSINSSSNKRLNFLMSKSKSLNKEESMINYNAGVNWNSLGVEKNAAGQFEIINSTKNNKFGVEVLKVETTAVFNYTSVQKISDKLIKPEVSMNFPKIDLELQKSSSTTLNHNFPNQSNSNTLNPKDFESSNYENETKILELKNENLKLKTIIYKKNKKIEEYEKTVNKNKQVEQYLAQAKNNLINISNYLKDNKSLKKHKRLKFRR